MIHYAIGDIFATNVDAYAHGCNCQGKMGAGIAIEFRKRWPSMYKEYAALCGMGHLRPGNVFEWSNVEPRIFNLMTQPDTKHSATVEAIKESMEEMIRQARAKKIRSIAMPVVGCGLGGLDWETQVKPVIESLDTRDIDLYIAVTYKKGKSLK